MPTSSSGRESRRSSKSGESTGYKSSDRREKAKSSQVYDTSRRPSRQAESGLGIVVERPGLKQRTNSAPVVETLANKQGKTDGDVDGEQVHKEESSASTPRATRVEDGRDEDEVAGVVGAISNFQPFQAPEVRYEMPASKTWIY